LIPNASPIFSAYSKQARGLTGQSIFPVSVFFQPVPVWCTFIADRQCIRGSIEKTKGKGGVMWRGERLR